MINLSDNEEVLNKVTQSLEDYFVVYKQYLHKGICKWKNDWWGHIF